MNTQKIDFLLLFLYCGFIYWLSSQEKLPAPMWFNFQDKLYHAAAYAIMGILAWRSFRSLSTKPIILIFLSIGFCSLYGFSDEWHQSYVPGRNSSIEDWYADTLGAAIAVWLAHKFFPAPLTKPLQAAVECRFNCVNCSQHHAK